MVDVIGTEKHRARSEANISMRTSLLTFPGPTSNHSQWSLKRLPCPFLVPYRISINDLLTVCWSINVFAKSQSRVGISNISFSIDLACSCLFSLARTRTSTNCMLSRPLSEAGIKQPGVERGLYRYRMPIC